MEKLEIQSQLKDKGITNPQLLKAFEENSYHIGFGTHSGTVAAAHNWGNAMSIINVNNSLPKNY